ncbi:PREDICTED: uncharacterized protein LOC109333912 [Lupinus angustifolius]|uniref:uncharacterized protein LOC109333912 n=1 Tax=Lupinus angustifolius TaxID=3871 RepID=UPI00092F4F8C|nr:PREDICTED: uncharacterized protein LOC109333912 [Lupinus angustifolius]
MDFIESLPNSQGKQVIFVVMDRLSKSAHFMPLSHPYTAGIVAESFMDIVFKLHGFPDSIISDRDPIFISHFWQELIAFQGVQLNLSTAYHPQTDKQTENRMKQVADRHKSDREFQVGDKIYVKLQSYRQISVAARGNEKLSPKYFGHFEVLSKIGVVAYKLQLSIHSKVHNVFHVSQLKKHIGQEIVAASIPATIEEGTRDREPEAILDKATVKRRGRAVTKVLVQWKHHLPEDATWEFYFDLCKQFPHFHS